MSSPADVPLLDDAEVEARTVLGDKQVGHLRLVQPQADPVARHPRLGDLEFGAADAVAVADADVVIGKSAHGEVLTEMARLEVVAVQKRFPEVVGLDLVHHHGTVLSAV